jgi:MFS transporter, MHS family, proline/betaine transporter
MPSQSVSKRWVWRQSVLLFAALGSLASIMAHGPIAQDPAYHDFADGRAFLGIPNFLNVASNVPFLLVGLVGVAMCAGRRREPLAASWSVFFIGATLVCFGSAYYHWAPSDATLLWDRLPMTLAFMGLLVAVVGEHVGGQLERLMLVPALAAGLLSALWWHWTGDLRLYVWVQAAPVVGILLVLAMFPARYTHRSYLLYGLGLYVLAKLTEIADRDIFALTTEAVSGHTLKHLLAAGALLLMLAMLWRRAPVGGVTGTQPQSSLSKAPGAYGVGSWLSRGRLLPIIIGNVFEWFDFTIYGFFATTIARQFFPPGNERAAALATAATFGVAFVMRPIGAAAFGLIGDRWGRKTSLTLTFALMALGTAMIGLAPTFASVGVFATLIVVLGRLLQGFSASGEVGSALTLLIESSAAARQGVATGWLNVGVYSALVFGSLAGLAVTTLLSPTDAQDWGWRVPFLFGLLIAPIGLYMRRHMDESQEFLAARRHRPAASAAGPVDSVRPMLRGIATIIGLAGFSSPVVYLILIFMPSYAVRELSLPQKVPMLSTLVASVLLVSLLVPMGWLCDRVGSKPLIFSASAVGSALVVPLMLYLTSAPSLASLLLLQCSLCVCLAMYVTSGGPMVVSLFPVPRRALGIGLGYNVGIIIFGAFAPLITGWLIQASGDKLMTAWYVLGGGLISVLAALTLREPNRAGERIERLS